MSLLIRNGRIVTAVDDYDADVFVEDETVSLIGRDLDVEADRTIDAAGRLVIPGGVDPHTHMDMPFGGTTSADDFETGTPAARRRSSTSRSRRRASRRSRGSRRGMRRRPGRRASTTAST